MQHPLYLAAAHAAAAAPPVTAGDRNALAICAAALVFVVGVASTRKRKPKATGSN